MKRWCCCLLVGVLVAAVIWMLSTSGVDPSHYVGKWYSYEDDTPYLFYNGIIISEKYHLALDEDEIFSGAYSFSEDRLLLFFINGDGVETERELKLMRHSDGDRLVDQAGDGNTIVFYRKK